MSVKTETLLVRNIMKSLRQDYQFDGYHVHGSLLQRSGEPDIDGSIWAGGQWLHLKIEVKTPNGVPSPLQIERLREYHRRSYVAGIVTDLNDMTNLLAAYMAYDMYKSIEYKPFIECAYACNITNEYGIY